MIKLSQEKLKHLLIGATFFSTGGGGSLDEGLELIREIDELTLLDVDEADPERLCATAYLVGSVSPPRLEELKQKYNLELNDASELVVGAFKYLEEKLNRKISYVLPVELGGYNTAVSLLLAAKMNRPVINADLTGRSAPEMYQTSYFVGNIPPTPATAVTLFNDKLFFDNVMDYDRLDKYLRATVSISDGYDVGVANFPLPIKDAIPYFIKNTLSKCIKIGALLEKKKVFEAIKLANGKIIFKGYLKEEKFIEKDGFTQGSVILENFSEEMRLEYKNEILVSFQNEKIIASVPDLIGIVTSDGRPIINTEVPIKQELIIYTIPAPSIWKSSIGESVFNLNHFGYAEKKFQKKNKMKK